jgi:uncharacterized protein with NRDE domain
MLIQYNGSFLQRDDGTRDFIEWQFKQEKKKRQVQTNKEGTLFDWDEVESLRNKGRSHSIISELYYAANKARIEINFEKRIKFEAVWDGEEKNDVKYCKKGETAQEVGKIFEARHYENRLKQKCRDRTFCPLGCSKVSNFFISNPKAPNADNLIGFALRARNLTLWTSARKALIFKENGPETSYSCGNRRFCDLLHILNNCTYNLKEMTVRHNMIQEVLVDAIRKPRKINIEEILMNKEIDFEGSVMI